MMRVWGPLGLLVLWGMLAMLGPVLPLTPEHVELSKILVGPGFEEWLGFDDLGRPIVDRLFMGAQTSFFVALLVVLLSSVVGGFLGIVGAYIGGIVDSILVWVIDVFLSFPGLLLAIALAGLMGPGIENVIIALVAVGWVGYARLTRAQVLSLKEQDHVLAARAVGARPIRIMTRHLIPLVSAPLIVEASFGIAGTVIAEAGLSFLGLGVQPPAASWGSMIRDGARYMLVAPHMVLAPGVALMVVVLAINLLGDRLRDWLDVKGSVSRHG